MAVRKVPWSNIGGWVSVDDPASVAGLALESEGQPVWIASLKNAFYWDPTSSAAVNGNSVLSAAPAPGRLLALSPPASSVAFNVVAKGLIRPGPVVQDGAGIFGVVQVDAVTYDVTLNVKLATSAYLPLVTVIDQPQVSVALFDITAPGDPRTTFEVVLNGEVQGNAAHQEQQAHVTVANGAPLTVISEVGLATHGGDLFVLATFSVSNDHAGGVSEFSINIDGVPVTHGPARLTSAAANQSESGAICKQVSVAPGNHIIDLVWAAITAGSTTDMNPAAGNHCTLQVEERFGPSPELAGFSLLVLS